MGNTVRILYHMEQRVNKNFVLRNVADLDKEGISFFGLKDVQWDDGTISPGCAHCGCVYLIEAAGKRILVDSGIGDQKDLELVQSIYKRRGARTGLVMSPDGSVVEQLAKLGIQPDDVDIVINTHLHWDHVGSNRFFSNAKFYMPEGDLALALTCPRSAPHFFKEFRPNILNLLDNTIFTNGKTPIVPGVEMWQVGGHSPGSSFVMVKTDAGVVGIAGDVIPKYYHLENYWPGPADGMTDYLETIDAMKLMNRKADIVLPGHDWTVAERYPDGIIG